MNTTSTAFVLSLAVAAAVTAQERSGPRGKDALARAFHAAAVAARKHKAPILAFVLPPKDRKVDPAAVAALHEAERKAGMLQVWGGPREQLQIRTARELLLRQVQLLRLFRWGEAGKVLPHDAQMVFGLTVPVFARANDCGAKDGESVVLLDVRGARRRGFTLDLSDRDAFVAQLGKELFGADELAGRRANVPPDLERELAKVQKELRRKQPLVHAFYDEQKLKPLAPKLFALGPALVERRDGRLQPVRELWSIELARTPLGAKATLPIGGDSCPGCGMGYTPDALMTVLKLVGP